MTDEKMTIELGLLITQTVSAVALPIIVAGFGWYISRKVEQFRLAADRETLWRDYWAFELLKRVNSFLDASTSITMTLWNYQKELEKEEELSAEKKTIFSNLIETEVLDFQRLEWELKILTHASGDGGKKVAKAAEELFGALSKILSDQQGNFEHVREFQKALIDATKKAHTELLGAN